MYSMHVCTVHACTVPWIRWIRICRIRIQHKNGSGSMDPEMWHRIHAKMLRIRNSVQNNAASQPSFLRN